MSSNKNIDLFSSYEKRNIVSFCISIMKCQQITVCIRIMLLHNVVPLLQFLYICFKDS